MGVLARYLSTLVAVAHETSNVVLGMGLHEVIKSVSANISSSSSSENVS